MNEPQNTPDTVSLLSRSDTRGKKYPVELLTKEEITNLIRQCSPKCATGKRNRALLVVLWRASLRISEALSLKPSDIEPDSIRVLRGKGDRSRTVGIDPAAYAILSVWIQERLYLGLPKNSALFCSLKGARLMPVYVRNLMKRLAKRAGIDKRVHPHQLRHTGATELLREGVNIGIIQRQLGHASIATTHRYLNHLSPREVIETISSREGFSL